MQVKYIPDCKITGMSGIAPQLSCSKIAGTMLDSTFPPLISAFDLFLDSSFLKCLINSEEVSPIADISGIMNFGGDSIADIS